jgi:hypothetical protein
MLRTTFYPFFFFFHSILFCSIQRGKLAQRGLSVGKLAQRGLSVGQMALRALNKSDRLLSDI